MPGAVNRVDIQPLSADQAADAAALMTSAYSDVCVGASPWSAAGIASALTAAQTISLVIRVGPDRPMTGFLLARQVGEEAELLAMAIRQSEHRNGYGRILLTSLTERLKQAQSGVVFLEVAAANHPAIDFYRAHGFVISGRRPGYYRDQDALIMRLLL